MHVSLLLVLVAVILNSTSVFADEVVYPLDSGVINVKTAYGAKGDGFTDDTQALLHAIRANVGQYGYGILYFPTGTYLVSQRLDYLDASGNWGAFLTLQGENETNTVIKLADHASGFGDPTNPNAVIFTATNRGNNNPRSSTYNPNGAGNEGFRNHIKNLTVNTGSGNPGAIAIDYMANNNTTISDVAIVSGDGAGVYGLNMQRGFPGPLLIKNLSVSGFATAIALANSYGVWMEHVKLSGQSVSGIDVLSGSASVRDLQSTGASSAIRVPNWQGVVSVVDSNFKGGSSSTSAVQVGPPSSSGAPNVFLRNVASAGYQSLINQNGVVIKGSSVAEWSSLAPIHLFSSSPATSLDLPVQETPTYSDNNFENWANIVAFGAKANNPTTSLATFDSSDAIQAAIDSGKSTIYCPPGNYLISKTIHIRGGVKRFLALSAYFLPLNTAFPADQPAVQIDQTWASEIFIDGLGLVENFWVPGTAASPAYQNAKFPETDFVNNSSDTVVMTNMDFIGYKNTSVANGKLLFMESVFGNNGMIFLNQNVYARNLDPENWSTIPHVHISGGALWVLGFKTEGPNSSMLTADSGAQAELLGSANGLLQDVTSSTPMFVNIQSSISVAAYRSDPYIKPGGVSDYDVHASETIGAGASRTFYRAGSRNAPLAYKYGYGSSVSLFSDSVPSISKTSVLNAAPNYSSPSVAPGEVVSLYGAGLSPKTVSSPDTLNPSLTSLAGTSVTVNGVSAPLFYVSPGQINFQVPASIQAGAANILVNNNSLMSSPASLTVQPVSPGIYNLNGMWLFQNSLSPFNLEGTASTPVKISSTGAKVTLYGSGFGATTPTTKEGVLPASLARCAQTLTATLDTSAVTVSFCGLSPKHVGQYQINLQLPAGTAAGVHTLKLSMGGQTLTLGGVYTN